MSTTKHNAPSPYRRQIELQEANRRLLAKVKEFETGSTFRQLNEQISKLNQLLEHQTNVVKERNKLQQEKKQALRDLELLRMEHNEMIRKLVGELRALKADAADAQAIREAASEVQAVLESDRARLERQDKHVHKLETRLRREAEATVIAKEREEQAQSMYMQYVAQHEMEQRNIAKTAGALARVAQLLANRVRKDDDTPPLRLKRRYSTGDRVSWSHDGCPMCGSIVISPIKPWTWKNSLRRDSIGSEEEEKHSTALRYLADRANVVSDSLTGTSAGLAARRLAMDELDDALDAMEGGWLEIRSSQKWERSDADADGISALLETKDNIFGLQDSPDPLSRESSPKSEDPFSPPTLPERAATSMSVYSKRKAGKRYSGPTRGPPARAQAIAAVVLGDLRPWGRISETQERARRADGSKVKYAHDMFV